MSEDPKTVELPPDVRAEVFALLRQGRPVSAIHSIRAATGLGLYDGKMLMEAMIDEMIKSDAEARKSPS